MKNKSFYYVLPVFFYKLIDKEKISTEIADKIINSFLIDNNGNFVIEFNKDVEKYFVGKNFNIKINKDSLFLFINNDEEDLINTFINGEYSKINTKYITNILDFAYNHLTIEDYARIGYVIFKNESFISYKSKELGVEESILKTVELDSKANLEDETWSDEKITIE